MKAIIERLIKELPSGEYEQNFPLSRLTTMGIGGPADVLVRVHTESELLSLLQFSQKSGLPVWIMGGGSNLLVSDKGVRGAVVLLVGELASIQVSESGKEIAVGAGASFPVLTKKALDLGWQEALGWFGIPGQVGGALKMNAGTPLGEIGEVVHEVHGISKEGKVCFTPQTVKFSYRNTNFPPDVVLTRAVLRAENASGEEEGVLRQKAKELYRKRQLTQPKMKSAGSIFKNPPGDYAGRLIEAAGLKGQSRGQAEISSLHANFIVNKGGALAEDVYYLAQLAQKIVLQKFSVALEFEVKLVGEFPEC